ncbi:MAG: BMP family ABC transporter substrate-binding protein [Chloroflexi bacterium]|nr:BMP family ABC transporter substrate-binding protein [Chloroflexota bacterium]
MLRKLFNLIALVAMVATLGVNVASAAPPAQEELTYTVKLGDNLWTLAEKYLGSGPAYRAIVMSTNLKALEDPSFAKIKNPNLIHPGWKFLIPSPEEGAKLTAAWYAGAKTKIAVVSDIGGRGDLSFNDMAFKGGDDAARDFGVKMVEVISKVEADYVPNLTVAAEDPDVKLIVGVGFLLSDALAEVAKKYPDKNFAGIDTYSQFLVAPAEYPLPNLMDIVYEEHNGSALVGALGALLAAHYDKPHIGGVFGIEIPVLWKFEIGYKWGARWATEWLKKNKPAEAFDYTKDFVLWTYTGTFSDITKGYAAAKPMYAKDAVTVYNIAGPLGLGINQAVAELAEEKGLKMGPPFWTGVDANQDWINPGFVIASMMKRVDYGVYFPTKLVLDGTFRDVVKETNGSLVLGIGTETMGKLMEGISVSTLADLDEFIEMGVRAEELTGKKALPMPAAEIRAKAKAMRDAQPAWIWEAVAELEEQIRTGEVEVPLAFTEDDIKKWRDELG